MQNLKIPQSLDNSRLDKALSTLITDHSRSFIQKIINNQNVKVNGVIISDCDFKIKENDIIEYKTEMQSSSTIVAKDIPIDIVYEDEHIIVINKSAGLTVHPGAGNRENTLANALLHHFNYLSDLGGIERPGILHRLDKDTSGLMIVAKTNDAHFTLAKDLINKALVRKYKALIWGIMNPLNGTIVNNIARSKTNRKKMAVSSSGKEAISHYNTEKIFQNGLISLIECKLETGRTHQIRVHFSNAGHSIVGDQTYGNNSKKLGNCKDIVKKSLLNFKRQALHSYYIGFYHPKTKDFLEFTAGFGVDIQNIINDIS